VLHVNATFLSASGFVITRLDPAAGAEITGAPGVDSTTGPFSCFWQLIIVKSPAINNIKLIFFISDSI
jgi:hypothetical protein